MAKLPTDLERAFDALKAKNKPYEIYFDYYDGDPPLVYTSKRMQEIFRGVDVKFFENWAAVVIDSLKDRVNLTSITGPDQYAETIRGFIQKNEVYLDSDDVHEAAMITGESFYIIWPNDEEEPEGYYNDPRLCHIFYDSEKPRIKKFGCKWWISSDDLRLYLTLYYPDRLEYYVCLKGINPTKASAFTPTEEFIATNPYGEVPIFHFRPQTRKIKSDLTNVIAPQNGINKLLTDMMVTAEFGAFAQRWVITDADIQGKLQNAPNEIWQLPSGDGTGQGTSVGQFQSSDLENYLKAIDNLAQAIAIITRTPKHYFFAAGGDPSGEALITMEAPLTKKAQDRIDRFIPSWQDAIRFALKIKGIDVMKDEITVQFDNPETVQPRTTAEIREINSRAGIPLTVTLREEGKTDAEIEKIMEEKAKEEAAAQKGLGQALLAAKRNFDQNNTDDENPTT